MADIRNTGTWQRVERGLSEMANLISRGEYNFALVKGRQTMEQIVRLSAGQNFVVYTDLADTIEKLYQGHYIEKESRDSFHTIRVLGNKAVHEGNNSPQDAQKSFRLLKQEIEAFIGDSPREAVSESRKPVPVRREAATDRRSAGARREESEHGRRYSELDDRGDRSRHVPNREERIAAQRAAQRGGTARGQRGGAQGGINVYDILRILIPVICLILLVVLIRSLIPKKESVPETTPAVTTEAPVTEAPTTEAPTTEAPTTEPPVTRYRIKGEAVNIRYADNDNRVYTQLSNGTEIGEVQEIEGSDKVSFTLDGIAVTVNKNYIEPIE